MPKKTTIGAYEAAVMLKPALHDFFAKNGAKGGKSKSPKKLKALAANLAKANAALAKARRKKKAA